MKISYFIFTAWSEINYLAKKLLPCYLSSYLSTQPNIVTEVVFLYSLALDFGKLCCCPKYSTTNLSDDKRKSFTVLSPLPRE